MSMPRLKLTTAAIERLKQPDTYWDATLPAFGVRVSKTGVKAFVYVGRVHGKQEWATLEPRFPALGLADARRKAGEAAESMRGGVSGPATKRAAKAAPRDSFDAVADEWLKRDQATNRSFEEVKRVIDRDVKPAWTGRSIKTITR